MFKGYAIDNDILKELSEIGCNEIRIKDLETNIKYKTSLYKWEKHGIHMNFDGEQMCLPLKYMEQY